MIKVAAPRMALQVIDDAIQACGGAGVTTDFGLARMLCAPAHAAPGRRPGRSAQPHDRATGIRQVHELAAAEDRGGIVGKQPKKPCGVLLRRALLSDRYAPRKLKARSRHPVLRGVNTLGGDARKFDCHDCSLVGWAVDLQAAQFLRQRANQGEAQPRAAFCSSWDRHRLARRAWQDAADLPGAIPMPLSQTWMRT